MSRLLGVLGLALVVGLVACSNSDEDKSNPPADQPDAAVAEEAGEEAAVELPKCPDEKDLKTANLPCDCYGHEANATTVDDKVEETKCKTQVVCCPSISDLRCEDHEFCDDAGNCYVDAGPDAVVEAAVEEDAAAEAAVEDAAPDVTYPKCPIEKDLSLDSVTKPCSCYGTVVTDPAVDFPDCIAPKKVICCPGSKKPICE